MQSSGFSVNTQSRNDVVAFWHAVYQASEGYENRIKWSGNYSGNAGTTSDAFLDDVERRLNYFRAMCGVPANVRVNTGSSVLIMADDAWKPAGSTLKSTAAQTAALMLSRNYNSSSGSNPAISHNPTSSITGWSTAAWNANAHGNFAFGVYGPGAVTEYMVEALTNGSATSSWNSAVGHRRWNLFPRSTDFASGDQPGESAYRPPTNVLYSLPKSNELLPAATAPAFVSYPAAGFFPAPINSPFWSVSRANADFSSATVKVTTVDGKSIPVSSLQRSTGFGDPALVWRVGGGADTTSVFKDTTFHVKISGIAGTGLPSTYSYTVTLINPNRITTNQAMNGPEKPKPDQKTTYKFTPPKGAESLQVEVFKILPSKLLEDAETPSQTHIIDETTGGYPLSALPGFGSISGAKSFNLTFPTIYDLLTRGVPEQRFEIDREIIARKGATLDFSYRRGYMTTTSVLVVEQSANDGLTWKPIGNSIKGVSNNKFDSQTSSMSIPLPQSDFPIRIRFRYYTTGGAIYTHEAAPTQPTGIFIDEIGTKKCDFLERQRIVTLPKSADKFVLDQKTAGEALVKGDKWQLRLRTKLGGRFFYGPAKSLTIAAP